MFVGRYLIGKEEYSQMNLDFVSTAMMVLLEYGDVKEKGWLVAAFMKLTDGEVEV